MGEAEQNEMDALAEIRAKYGESSAEDDIEKVAKAKAEQRLIPPKVIEFRRNLRTYLDAGLTFDAANARANQDYEDTEFLREPNSNILDVLECKDGQGKNRMA